jgi:adenylate kinase family enzyme
MRLHLLGPSGSGTTTLGRALSVRLGVPLLDADDYFWMPTDPPFSAKRPAAERSVLLGRDARADGDWIVSGSMMGWGDFLIPCLELAIYLWKPAAIRRERLERRERERFGSRIDLGGPLRRQFETFIAWAMDYDSGGEGMRSRLSEEAWMARLACPVLRLEGEMGVEECVERVLDALRAGGLRGLSRGRNSAR